MAMSCNDMPVERSRTLLITGPRGILDEDVLLRTATAFRYRRRARLHSSHLHPHTSYARHDPCSCGVRCSHHSTGPVIADDLV